MCSNALRDGPPFFVPAKVLAETIGGPGPGQRLDGAFGGAVQRGGWDAEADDSGANFTRRIPGWRTRWSTSFPGWPA
jgi:hypothetical protein